MTIPIGQLNPCKQFDLAELNTIPGRKKDWSVFSRVANRNSLEAARMYIDAGFQVVGIEDEGDRVGKRPVYELPDSSVVPDGNLQLFEKNPGRNIGLVTGGDFWVLDIDGDTGLKSLAWLRSYVVTHTDDNLDLSETIRIKTRRGSHLYFLSDDALIPTYVSLLPGIDVRGEGGCVIAPPSAYYGGLPGLYELEPLCRPRPSYAPEALVELTLCAPLTYKPQLQRRVSS